MHYVWSKVIQVFLELVLNELGMVLVVYKLNTFLSLSYFQISVF